MISDRGGTTTAYALDNLQKRGELFIGAGADVYEGLIIGESSRAEEMPANPPRPTSSFDHPGG
jgi:GTP-binding protein